MTDVERTLKDGVRRAGDFSEVIIDNGSVLKKVHAGRHFPGAINKLDRLIYEYSQMKDFIGSYVLDTSFKLRYKGNNFYIQLDQKQVIGIPLRESLDPHDPLQKDFFRKCLNFYIVTGMMPDLVPDIMPDPTLGMMLTKKYTYRAGPNVYLVDGSPVLVDTTLNRGLRHSVTGPTFNHLLASRIKSLIAII